MLLHQAPKFRAIFSKVSPLDLFKVNQGVIYNAAARGMTSDSGSDAAGKGSNTAGSAQNRVHDLVTKSKQGVFVFMKGNPKEPSCRYSGIVVQVLDAYGVKYDSVDVLEDPEIRQEVKKYTDWPTIPQVFVNGSFIGGCDILLQMHQSGELKQLFKQDK